MTRRDDAPDAVWHVSSRVNWKVWHLEPERAYELVLRELARVLDAFLVELFAWVVMSNHFHVVVRSPAERGYRELTGRRTGCRHLRPWPRSHPKSTVIGQCIGRFKHKIAMALQEELELSGHFWDGKHHRRRLWDAWALIVATAYDHRNPVRAGMVARPHEYERSSAAWWAGTAPSPIVLASRPDFPFGLDRDVFRANLLRFQEDKRLDDVMEVFQKSNLPIDSPKGRAYLERLMAKAGLDPLGCGSRAALLNT